MANADSQVTIHMAASLDGFIARKDGRVDWLETSDEFVGGDTMDPGFVEAFLKTIDCYVMGSRTYETALRFEAQGSGWAYGDKTTFVLTSRELPRTRDTVEFRSGDLAELVNGQLRPTFRTIWFVGGGIVSAQCLRLGLVASCGQCGANGGRIIKPLAATAWGTRDFYIEDPDGYIVCFGGRPAAE